jgi:hypothetical protein
MDCCLHMALFGIIHTGVGWTCSMNDDREKQIIESLKKWVSLRRPKIMKENIDTDLTETLVTWFELGKRGLVSVADAPVWVLELRKTTKIGGVWKSC